MKENNEITTLQENQLELVVSKKTIGSLVTNAKAIKTLVEKQIELYDISNYSTDDIAKCKQDKALLNKAAKALNDKRISLEKEWNTPFEEFKSTVKETVDLIKSAATKIDSIIKQDEESCKNEKLEEIRKVAEKVGFNSLGIRLEKIMNPKWMNKGTSIKSIEKDISEKVKSINADIETLKTYGYIGNIACTIYVKNLDLNEAIQFANELQKKKAAEGESKQEAQQANEPETAPESAPVENKPVEQPAPETTSQDDAIDAFNDALGLPPVARQAPELFDRSYVVTASLSQLAEIEKYLDSLGVNYKIG